MARDTSFLTFSANTSRETHTLQSHTHTQSTVLYTWVGGLLWGSVVYREELHLQTIVKLAECKVDAGNETSSSVRPHHCVAPVLVLYSHCLQTTTVNLLN